MPYEIRATSETPALIIFLIDVGASMRTLLGDKRCIDIVEEVLRQALTQMVFQSAKGGTVRPRYRVAMYAYSDEVYDVYDGIKTIDKIVQLGHPELTTLRTTETAKAFQQAKRLLEKELPRLENCPAPLVCHLTDGEYTGADPEPIAREIMQMRNPDGHVLVENIFISDRLLTEPISDVYQWTGIRADTPLENKRAVKLRAMSSPMPERMRIVMLEMGYNIAENALLLYPGTTPELIAMALGALSLRFFRIESHFTTRSSTR